MYDANPLLITKTMAIERCFCMTIVENNTDTIGGLSHSIERNSADTGIIAQWLMFMRARSSLFEAIRINEPFSCGHGYDMSMYSTHKGEHGRRSGQVHTKQKKTDFPK